MKMGPYSPERRGAGSPTSERLSSPPCDYRLVEAFPRNNEIASITSNAHLFSYLLATPATAKRALGQDNRGNDGLVIGVRYVFRAAAWWGDMTVCR